MTEAQIIKEIQNEIQLSCALPYALPPAEVQRIIQRAKAWFYDNYGPALEERLIGIPLEVFQHPDFLQNRVVQMPDCVQFVYDLREVSGIGILGNPDRDFSESKMLGAEIFLSPFQGDNLVFRTAMYSYFDLAETYNLVTVAYRWNKNTKRISVVGRNPIKSCWVRAGVQIPAESLYDDEIFMRYCFAQAKINLGRILQIFKISITITTK